MNKDWKRHTEEWEKWNKSRPVTPDWLKEQSELVEAVNSTASSRLEPDDSQDAPDAVWFKRLRARFIQDRKSVAMIHVRAAVERNIKNVMAIDGAPDKGVRSARRAFLNPN